LQSSVAFPAENYVTYHVDIYVTYHVCCRGDGNRPFGLGGYAEYAVASIWTRKPDTVSWIDAAALPSSAEAAVGVLRQLDVTSGETLLLFGGGGSVGIIATQLAAARGITLSDPAAADFGVTLSQPTPDRAPGALDATIALLADGRLRLRAHQSMPMQQAAEAHRQLETGTVHERIILTL
jgi:NADPH:quinone reductase-like Zn-dependent oxidoreductase